MKIYGPVLALLVLTVGTTSAPRAAEGVPIYGAGGNTCGQWVANRKNGEWYNEGQWLLGFVTAFYAMRPSLKDMGAGGGASFTLFLDNYCAAHPLNDVADGASALIAELGKAQ